MEIFYNIWFRNKFLESVNLLDVYGELQKKHPNFTEEELKAEMITLYATVSKSFVDVYLLRYVVNFLTDIYNIVRYYNVFEWLLFSYYNQNIDTGSVSKAIDSRIDKPFATWGMFNLWFFISILWI